MIDTNLTHNSAGDFSSVGDPPCRVAARVSAQQPRLLEVRLLKVKKHSRSIAAFAMLSGAMALGSCGSTPNTQKTYSDNSVVVQEKADPFVILDEQQKTGSIDPQLIQERLDAARQQWLRALSAQQRSDRAAVVRRFEQAIDILNRLIYYPGVADNADFQGLTKSVIGDYEKYVATIDSLPENASVFALQKKFDEEMAKMDVAKVPMPRMDLSKTVVPLPMNTPVEQTIAYFTQGNGRPYMAKWLNRTGKYFPMMRKIMKEEGVPEEIMHLAMIESGLSPVAMSWAKAVGLWQFIDATGSRYGLTNNWWLDKRRDPVKATRAAAQHLRDLYVALGDWHLALAAYNSGINRVRAAINQAGGNRDFWTIKQYLPKETQNYVPLFIAATMIEMDPERYGFNNVHLESPLAYDEVYVKDATDINALAKAAHVSALEIKELNPELLQPSTPPVEICGPDGYCLKLPRGTATGFAERLAQVPDAMKKPWTVHVVQRGETLRTIARNYNMLLSDLADYNNLSLKAKVKRGGRLRIPMTVMVPSPGVAEDIKATSALARPRTAEGNTLRHKVRRGETLRSLATRYGVSAASIKSANHMRSNGLRIGQVITITNSRSNVASKTDGATSATASKRSLAAQTKPEPAKKWVNYTVRRGDTMGKIADALSVTVPQLRGWNRRVKSAVRIGQTLRAYTDADVAEGGTEPSSAPKSHIVRSGETMYSIARTYGVDVADLKSWNNNKKAEDLQAGETLKIYGQNITPSKGDRMATGARRSVTYRVKRGDTLFSIADKYGVTVNDLRSANRLRSSHIRKGQKLTIPSN